MDGRIEPKYSPLKVKQGLMAKYSELGPFFACRYYFFRIFLPSLLLIDDKMAMAHSVENRVPFLENSLVDFALSLPPRELFNDLTTKSLVSRSMSNLLP